VPLSFDRKIIEVDAAKNDACVSRSGNESDVTIDAGMEADTFAGGFPSDGSLEHLQELE